MRLVPKPILHIEPYPRLVWIGWGVTPYPYLNPTRYHSPNQKNRGYGDRAEIFLMGSFYACSFHSTPLFKTLEKPSIRVRVFPNSKHQLFQSPPFYRQMSSSMRASHSEDNGASIAMAEASQRIGEVKRVTKETDVYVKVNLDGSGICDCSTGIPFLDHMLDQLASHGLFDLCVKASGDIHIDDHHTNEDVALAIGTALLHALGDRKGIRRFGDVRAPLDEACVEVTLDLSGRPHLSYGLQIPTERVGTYDTQLVEHFFQSLVNTSGMTLHINQHAGKNSHHIIEATFKAFARALRQATEFDPRRRGSVPSSKGVLSRS